MDAAGGDQPERYADHVGRLRRELLRLDPWSFWIVSLESDGQADFAVVGTTGAFLLRANGDGGFAIAEGRTIKIEGKPLKGLRGLKRAARRASKRLHDAAVFADVMPVVCLTRAAAGAPRTVSGVRVAPLPDLIRDVIERERVIGPSRAERGAAALGPVIARDSRSEATEDAGG
jgi:hypothetical protein